MKHRLTLLLAPNCAKNLYFHDFPIQMYGPIGQKHVTRYPGMLPRVFGLEIAYVASPYHPGALKKNLRLHFYRTLNVSSDVATIC